MHCMHVARAIHITRDVNFWLLILVYWYIPVVYYHYSTSIELDSKHTEGSHAWYIHRVFGMFPLRVATNHNNIIIIIKLLCNTCQGFI